MKSVLIIFFLLLYACKPQDPAHKDATINFKENGDKFQAIQKFIASNPYEIHDFQLSDGNWQTRGKSYIDYLQSINQTKNSDLDTIIQYLNSLNIGSVYGDSLFVEFHFNNRIKDCYVIRYDKNAIGMFTNDSLTINDRNKMWRKELDSNWYAMRVSCL